MSKITVCLSITDEDKLYLQSLIRTRTIQAQVVDRARILLFKADGKTDNFIAEGLGVGISTVRRCIAKYNEGGFDNALFDAERPGRPIEITDDAKSWIISIACQKPCDLGYAAELWTLAALHKHIKNNAEAAGYSRLATMDKSSFRKC